MIPTPHKLPKIGQSRLEIPGNGFAIGPARATREGQTASGHLDVGP
jgi:hypothetical protein